MTQRGSRLADRGLVWSAVGLVAIVLAVLVLQVRFGLCTQDDAFISFRYAHNLVQGHGLVFNAGERVEGYTNFLWTVLFAPPIALGVDPASLSVLMGMGLTALMLGLTWWGAGRDWLAPLLVAAFAGLALEAVQGLETLFYAVLVTGALLASVRRDGRWAVFAGLAALTRPEGYAIAGLLWLTRHIGPRKLGPALKEGGMVAAITVPHLVFRVLYYGDIVPNTFHAKVGGFPILRGIEYIGHVGWQALPLALGLAVSAGFAVFGRRRPRALSLAAAVLIGFTLVYVVAVGGDFKGTGRFLIPIMPAAAMLAVAGPRWWRLLLGAAAIGWSVPGYQHMQAFADRFATELVRRRAAGLFLAQVVPSDWMIAVHAAGVLPYYAQRETLDMWGLNDPHIARSPVAGMGQGTAGHERHDYAYVLSRRPELILPERGLLTAEPLDLGDPQVFGPGFLDDYEPVSLALGALAPDAESTTINLWRRRPSASP